MTILRRWQAIDGVHLFWGLNKMNQFIYRIRKIRIKYPLWLLLSFLGCYWTAEAFISRYWRGLLYKTELYAKVPIYLSASGRLSLLLVIILALMILIDNLHVFARKRIAIPAALIPGTYMMIIAILSIVTGLMNAEGFRSPSTILFSSVYFILVAVTEELVYRGVTADIFLKTFLFNSNPYGAGSYDQNGRKAIWTAIICSGLVFGLAHLSNVSHSSVSGVLVQMLGAFLMGMVLTAVYYRTANIYAVIILHAVNDIAAALPATIVQSQQTISDVISGYGIMDILMLLPYLAVLLIILRPSKMEEIWGCWIAEQNRT